MAAVAALLLVLAAIVALFLRGKAVVAATRQGDSLLVAVRTRKNKFVGIAVAAAFVLAVLLAFSSLNWFGGLVVLLASLVAGSLLVAMAFDWPGGVPVFDRIHLWIWSDVDYVRDPAVDPRLDSGSPVYDRRLDQYSFDYDEDYFEYHARVVRHGKRWGFNTFVVAMGVMLLTVIVAAIIALVSNASFDSFGGAPARPGAQPNETATTDPAQPTAEPTSSPKATPTTTAPAADKPLELKGTCGDIKKWLPAVPKDKVASLPFVPQGAERCVDKSWSEWSGAAPEFVTVTRAIDVPLESEDGVVIKYRICYFQWKGADVVIRYPAP